MERFLNRVNQALSTQCTWRCRPFKDGLTNKNYLLTADEDGRQVALRIIGEEAPWLGIDRDTEAQYVAKIAAAGIGPSILHRDSEIVISEYVAGERVPDSQAADPEVIYAVAESLRTLHAIPAFGRTFDPGAGIRSFMRQGRDLGLEDPDGFAPVWAVFLKVEAAAAAYKAPLVPCHNDMNGTNVIILGGKAKLLDFEYAGLNKPLYELAKWCAHHSLDVAAINRVFAAAEPEGGDELLHFFHLQTATAWMWQVGWLFLQSVKDKKQSDFPYAQTCLQRMDEFMSLVHTTGMLR